MTNIHLKDTLKDCRFYVLTIQEKSGERVRSASAQLQEVGADFRFIEGVLQDSSTFATDYSHTLNRLWMKRLLSSGEISCYLGHRKMWMQFLADGGDHAVFLEDDFRIENREKLITAINDGQQCSDTWDVLKLFDFKPKKIIRSRMAGETQLVAHKYPASGVVAYMLNKKAAGALLQRKRVFRPVDEDMAHMWEFGIRIWSVHPNPVTEASSDLGGSLLEPERLRMRANRVWTRSIWGNILQGYKLVFSFMYRFRLRA